MYVCENVDSALAYVNKWRAPLLILVNNADSAAAAATCSLNCDDIPEFYASDRVHGKKVINPNFRFGSEAIQHSGPLQRRALEVFLKESRLDSVVVVHLIVAGSAAHELFVAAVPEAKDVAPCLFVFSPKQSGMERVALHGPNLTPANISNVLRTSFQALQVPESTGARSTFLTQVGDMNAAQQRLLLSQPQDAGAPRFGALSTVGVTPAARAAPAGDTTRTHPAVPSQMGEKRAGDKDEGGVAKGDSDEAPHSKRSVVECRDGEGCRVKYRGGGSDERLETETVSGPEEGKQTEHPPCGSSTVNDEGDKTAVATADSQSASNGIDLRCGLPNGETYTVRGLDSSTATLAANVREQVATLLEHNEFVFARPYPPHRFTVEEETRTLETIGMRNSSVVRVIPTGAPSYGAATSQVKSGATEVFGMVSSWFGRASGFGNSSTAPQASGTSATRAARPPNSRVRTMAQMLAENEEEENRRALRNSAMEGGQGSRANRYYGGASTEYVGRDDGEDSEDEEVRRRS
ncbi:uncharacterized protein TEOVI_000763000 [Trypanosoma equiperdum]|uniref:UBX domain containing protein n=1 Tax=Trypanosoma equiperdum TaxID=5694 RepID=A0A1G4IKK5_TRYEQ|nr:hypothetical protein, conserved [Trypanosoma equiperdum]